MFGRDLFQPGSFGRRHRSSRGRFDHRLSHGFSRWCDGRGLRRVRPLAFAAPHVKVLPNLIFEGLVALWAYEVSFHPVRGKNHIKPLFNVTKIAKNSEEKTHGKSRLSGLSFVYLTRYLTPHWAIIGKTECSHFWNWVFWSWAEFCQFWSWVLPIL